jgi:hypothetical protein
MKFLCLCYYDQDTFDALSESDRQALGGLCRPHDEALRASGRLIMVGSLAEPSSSCTLRPGTGGPSVSKAPYAGTREPLGAFFIIEAEDMEEAIDVASKHPGAQLGQYFGGGVEVRPIDTLEQPGTGRS